MATVDLDRRGLRDWHRLETKLEYSGVKNKAVEVGEDKPYILHVALVARIELASPSPIL
jgi:hypothetical protein